ncbi:ion transporter [Kordiimonas aquimaris]|uniref:ion transporter n=1 Tax=Kordiimonas aquimaris TaxID=707591 RepID=UPI0021CF5F56|nr:ion transporter [Kordiimonas aquimaris]
MALRRKAFDFLELGSFGSRAGAVFEYMMIVLIVANVFAVALETVDHIWQTYGFWLHIFNVFSVAVFTIEYAARVWVSAEGYGDVGDSAASRRLRYILSPMAIIDAAAIAPFFLGAFVTADLRTLRIFRLLRLLKLVRYSPALSSLTRVIYQERRALVATFIIMMGLLFFSATIAYLLEHEAQPVAFGSIPAALWWALSTLTTVGYGDVVPVTDGGRVLGSAVMIIGFVFYALPIGIIASGFSDEVHRREFVVPLRVIEDFPIFQHLPNEAAKDLATRVRTLSASPGTVLSHKMDMNNGLYCILSGEVSAFYQHKAIPLESGDFFGECNIISDKNYQPATLTNERTKVIWLESVDLHMLLSIYPEFAQGMLDHAGRRLKTLVSDNHIEEPDKQVMYAALNQQVSRQ